MQINRLPSGSAVLCTSLLLLDFHSWAWFLRQYLLIPGLCLLLSVLGGSGNLRVEFLGYISFGLYHYSLTSLVVPALFQILLLIKYVICRMHVKLFVLFLLFLRLSIVAKCLVALLLAGSL